VHVTVVEAAADEVDFVVGDQFAQGRCRSHPDSLWRDDPVLLTLLFQDDRSKPFPGNLAIRRVQSNRDRFRALLDRLAPTKNTREYFLAAHHP
jgi:hypothetical protein